MKNRARVLFLGEWIDFRRKRARESLARWCACVQDPPLYQYLVRVGRNGLHGVPADARRLPSSHAPKGPAGPTPDPRCACRRVRSAQWLTLRVRAGYMGDAIPTFFDLMFVDLDAES